MRKSAAPSKLGSGFNSPVIGKTIQKPIQTSLVAKENVPVENAARSTASILSLLNRPKAENIVNQNIKEEEDSVSPTNCILSETNDTLVPSVENNRKRIFNVVYAKPSKKKHKTWEGDGILEVGEKSLLLKDTEGIVLGRGSGKKNSELCEGSRLFVGNKEVEIIDMVNPVMVKKRPIDKSSEHAFPQIAMKVLKKRNTLSIGSIGTAKSSRGFSARPLECAPLVMPRPDQEHQWYCNTAGVPLSEVVVDSSLTRILRDHQKEGVVFLYKCVTGICNISYTGAILADEMGLGKTLQCIALIWTLLKQGPYGCVPLIKRVLIVTPSSLTRNWQQEFVHWLGSEKIKTFVVDNKNKPKDFMSLPNHPVLIISYEMFVRCFEEIEPIQFQLMICDEGHRLKNSSIKAYMLLNQLPCKRRILLTGTPVQNDLQEFFSLIDFVNPGILGTNSEFRKTYETSIVASRQPEANKDVEQEGEEKAQELNRKTSSFILRRTQIVLDQYLPKKYEAVIFCRPTPLQIMLYEATISYWEKRKRTGDADVTHLAVITMLKKISNHPILVQQQNEESGDLQEENLSAYLSSALSERNIDKPHIEDGSKLSVLTSLLQDLVQTGEKIVLISYFTQTLDLLEAICEQYRYKYSRLDGTTASAQRLNIVNNFNSPYSEQFVFILSARAGGVGLNLTGASRLVLFDSDWNPASDLQAMARIWRDGQKKSVHIYRFLTTGSIEEKIFQRQLSKAGLNEAVVDPENISAVRLADDELKDLFHLNIDVNSTTHEILQCTCKGKGDVPRPQEVTDCPDIDNRDCQLTVGNRNTAPSVLRMNQLFQWQHHAQPIDNDFLLRLQLQGAAEYITFIFHSISER